MKPVTFDEAFELVKDIVIVGDGRRDDTPLRNFIVRPTDIHWPSYELGCKSADNHSKDTNND